MQAHGLGRIVHAPVRGRHDVLPQHRQNTGLQRDRRLVSLFRIRRQPGRVRHRLARRGGARHPDNHGPVGAGIVMAAGILGVLLWGAPGFGTLAFTWLGVYVFLAMSGGGLYAFDTALFPAKRKN